MKLTRQQAAWFRFRRSGLAAPFESAEAAARALVGVQAQLLPAAGLALWNRTRGFDLREMERLVFDARSLVRFWGQRNTLHLYPTSDWPLLHAALQDRMAWFEGGFLKRGGDPKRFEEAVERTARRLRGASSLCRDDVRDLEMGLEELSERYWSGLFMSLVRRGLACHAEPGAGNEARFAHREVWKPDLNWNPPSMEKAKTSLTRRYFRSYGPAEARDLGYWWGTSAAKANRLIQTLRGELVEVDLQGRELLALREDVPELTEPAPKRWPVRLLYRFDPLLLGLKDKSWLLPAHFYNQVWRSGGHVEAVLLVKGRVAGTWRYNRRNQGLEIVVRPFAKLGKTVGDAVHRQARSVARFFNLTLEELTVDQPSS